MMAQNHESIEIVICNCLMRFIYLVKYSTGHIYVVLTGINGRKWLLWTVFKELLQCKLTWATARLGIPLQLRFCAISIQQLVSVEAVRSRLNNFFRISWILSDWEFGYIFFLRYFWAFTVTLRVTQKKINSSFMIYHRTTYLAYKCTNRCVFYLISLISRSMNRISIFLVYSDIRKK